MSARWLCAQTLSAPLTMPSNQLDPKLVTKGEAGMHAEVLESTTFFTAATWGSTCQAARSGTDPLRTHKWQLGNLAAVGTAVRISARTAMLIDQPPHPNKAARKTPAPHQARQGQGIV